MTRRQSISNESVAIYTEAFGMHDTEGAGNLPMEKLGAVLRSLGFAPTGTQLQQLQNKMESDVVTFEQMCEYIQALQEEPITEARAKLAFGFFDGGRGAISRVELKTLMTTRGDPISDAEAEAFLASVDPGSGMISREAFTNLCSS